MKNRVEVKRKRHLELIYTINIIISSMCKSYDKNLILK